MKVSCTKRAAPALAVLALAGVAVPATAHAGPRIDFKQVFTTPVPGASTGADTVIVYKHPDDPEGKPIPIRREVFTYPEGTQFDNAVVPPCEASEMQLQAQGESACPPESRVLNGEGTSMTGFGGETPISIAGFDDGSGLLLLAGDKQLGVRFATRARRTGRVITVDVPKTPGGPPEGESPLRRIHNVLDPHSLGDRAYIRTPPVCPRSGVWTFRAQFTFADGGVEEAVSESPCERDTTRPVVRVAGVPSPRRCASRSFRARIRVTDASPLARVRVRLDGRLLRTTTAATFSQRVSARRLHAGRHRLTVVARDAAGNTGRRTVRFRRC